MVKVGTLDYDLRYYYTVNEIRVTSDRRGSVNEGGMNENDELSSQEQDHKLDRIFTEPELNLTLPRYDTVGKSSSTLDLRKLQTKD